MCGILAVALSNPRQHAASELLETAYTVQHRGQDSCGIATSNDCGQSFRRRGVGLISEVFGSSYKTIAHLHGNIGISHVRYSTTRSYTYLDAQPLYSPAVDGVLLAHNGNLTNKPELHNYLKKIAYLPTNGESDSEHLLCVLASALQDEYDEHGGKDIAKDAFTAVQQVYELCSGSFACVSMFSGRIMGFRDAHGIKPLVYGERVNELGGKDYMFSSESVSLEKLGYQNLRDVRPGEAVLVERSQDGTMTCTARQIVPMKSYAPDIFEYVYFARPESVMDGIDVHQARKFMGVALAETIKDRLSLSGDEMSSLASDIDVIMPVPETSSTAALAAAQHLKIPYSQGLVRNRYMFRTFIMPRDSARLKGVWRKLTPVRSEFEGKNVLLIDDSIVRGNTAKEIVQMAREAGAKKVILASCSPAIRHNHIYGIDLASPQDLVAHARSESQVCAALGADELVYLPLPKLVFSCLQASSNCEATTFEVGLFTGKYATGVQIPEAETGMATGSVRKDVKKDVLMKEMACMGVGDCLDGLVEVFPSTITTALGRFVSD